MTSGTTGRDAVPLERLGRFQILGHIATGGMGSVYRAFDPRRSREVALKVLPADLAARPDVLERFRREAQHGTKLRHENIVALYEFGEVDGTYYLVMEYIDGTDLSDYLRSHGPISPDKARALFIQLTQALDHAHSLGIVHRDVKPSNVLLARRNGRKVAKLADLGLSRDMSEAESRVTRDGTTVGTVDYISPEQARDSGTADIRSDIYSLGCTFYHVLAGRPPFHEGGLAERIYKHCEVEPPDIRKFAPGVPEDLVEVLRRMLAKDPQDRYQTPAELLHDLLRRPSPARRPPPAVPTDTVRLRAHQAPPVPVTAAAPAAGADAGAGSTGLSIPGRERSVPEQFEWARQVLSVENYNDGVKLLMACCKQEPGSLRYRQALREAQQERHDTGPRPAWLAWVVALAPRVRMWLARRAGHHLEALAHGEEVLTEVPSDVGTQLLMAEEAEAAGLHDVAIWLVEQVLEEAPTSSGARRVLGRVFEHKKEYRRAIACWEQVAQIVPGDWEAGQKLRDLAALQTMERSGYPEGVNSSGTLPRRSKLKRDPG